MSTLAELSTKVTALETAVGNKLDTSDADAFYLMVVGIFVFFMQAGFALLEAGSVRAKNTKNILMKNLLDACIGAVVWWAWGYGIAYDGVPANQGFIGHVESGTGAKSFFTAGYSSGGDYAGWWFQYVFCAAAATIVSGAMAERTTLIGYLCYSVLLCGFVYPVVVFWTWGYGWVYQWNSGIIDFAGSGIVHMTGGIAALCGAAIVGPRKGRFDESKKPISMPASNTTFQVLGTFILWVGWYGFNPGSTLALAGSSPTMARAICTTTLAAAVGGITTVAVDKFFISHTWDVGMLCNGILAGLVSITAGAADVYPWAAGLLGFLGAFVYIGASKCVLHVCKVDDPLDAFAVHGASGAWGVIGASLLATQELNGNDGAFYGDGAHFVSAIVFIISNICWTGGFMCIAFVILKAAGLLRVSAEVEEAGMDVSKHGGSAYSNN